MHSNYGKTQPPRRRPPTSDRNSDRFCDGDDLAAYTLADDEWYDEPGLDSNESHWQPPGRHSQQIKRRLERILEKKRLNAALVDVFDEHFDDDWMPPQRNRRQGRAKRKQTPGV